MVLSRPGQAAGHDSDLVQSGMVVVRATVSLAVLRGMPTGPSGGTACG